jgi:hypothetical protein
MNTQRTFIVLILAIGLLFKCVFPGLAGLSTPSNNLIAATRTRRPTNTPKPPTVTSVPTDTSFPTDTSVPTDTPIPTVTSDTPVPQFEYTLTVSSAHGTVTKDPNKATYHLGDVVTLTSIPNTDWSFAYWSGGLSGSSNPASLTIQGSTVVAANYTQNEFTLTVSAANGHIVKDPDKAAYHNGDVVKLTAVPAPGWTFSFWGGDVTGTANPVSVTVSGNMTVTAKFNQTSNPTLPTNAPGIFNQPTQTPTGAVQPSQTGPTAVTQPAPTATPTLAAFVQPISTPVVPKFPEEAPSNNFHMQLAVVVILGAIAVGVLVWSISARRWRPGKSVVSKS